MKKIIAILIILMLAIGLPGTSLKISAQQIPSDISVERLSSSIDDYVADYIGLTSPGTAVVVFSNDEIIFSKGYGFADLTEKQPVHPASTVFEYGSVSKLFVYTTLMQLVEDGKLDLNADIQSYLPQGFLQKLRYDDPVTLIHIMNHQAGFEDVLLDVVVTNPVRKADFIEILESRQPEQVYQPGTVSAYSNFAVALAAYIAQRQLDQDFYAYLSDFVFQPLAMKSTTAHPDFLDQPQLKGQMARGYSVDAANSFQEEGWSYIPLYPIGAVSGTAEDLARFAMALLPQNGESGPLFKQRSTLDEMLSQTAAMGPQMSGFAHGFIEYEGRFRGLGHGGNTAGFTAQLNIIPEMRFGVIVLANAASEMHLTEGITRLLLGADEKLTDVSPGDTDLPDTEILEGSYIMARRPHNGFLKLYGFLSLLTIDVIGPNEISVSFAGQTANYIQTKPWLFEQTTAAGSLFEYNFAKLYFEMADGEVFRISGDFLPLPALHSVRWLYFDMLIAGVCALFFILGPLIFLLIKLIRRMKKKSPLSTAKIFNRFIAVIMLSGSALLINNGLLILRMLQDNYRAYSEVRFQLLLNLFLVLSGIAATCVFTYSWRQKSPDSGQKKLFFVTVTMLAGLSYVLAKWQFFS